VLAALQQWQIDCRSSQVLQDALCGSCIFIDFEHPHRNTHVFITTSSVAILGSANLPFCLIVPVSSIIRTRVEWTPDMSNLIEEGRQIRGLKLDAGFKGCARWYVCEVVGI
jgi:hypothetical protein